MTTVAFFNNKGGVGKTSLVYHLAWMLGEYAAGGSSPRISTRKPI